MAKPFKKSMFSRKQNPSPEEIIKMLQAKQRQLSNPPLNLRPWPPNGGPDTAARMLERIQDQVEAIRRPQEIQLTFSTEPIVAWRVWSVAPYKTREGTTESRLVPLTSAGGRLHYPPFRRLEAQCSHQHHDAPHRNCACGIWALKDPSLLTAATVVCGEVYLWGRVLEGERGYRAQYAYPKSLVCADEKLAEELRLLYGVPTSVGKGRWMDDPLFPTVPPLTHPVVTTGTTWGVTTPTTYISQNPNWKTAGPTYTANTVNTTNTTGTAWIVQWSE